MNKAQRIVSFAFAAFLWLISFSTLTAINGNGWIGFVSLLAGMGLILAALSSVRHPND